MKMSYMDNCTACEDKARELDFAQNKLDEIRQTLEHYQNERDHWDWDNLIDDIWETLEK